MAGTFTEGISKVLSGVYTLIKAAVSRVSIGQRGVVSYPFTSDWGPVNQITEVGNGSEFDKLFNGKNTSLSANKIFNLAFKGRPRKVLGYRMATVQAAKSTVQLMDGQATPGLAIGLETLYPTDRGFIAAVKDGVAPGEKVVEIIEDGVLLAAARGTTLDELTSELDATDFVRVTGVGTNLPVNTAGENFSGGNNGDIVTATEYSAFLTSLEAEEGINSFSLDGVTDDTIIESAKTWAQRVRTEGLYITFVNGGPAAWDTDPEAADTKSKSFNSRGIVNVGNGVDGYTASDMAIFVASRVAAVSLNLAVTDEETDFLAVNQKLTRTQRIAAKNSGTLVFVTEGEKVVIDEGVNTLTSPGADENTQMGKIRISNTLDQIATDLEAFGNEYKKGRSNTAEARDSFAAAVETDYLQAMANTEIIKVDFFYSPDPEYHGQDAVFTPKLDEAYFYASITPIDSMERLYQKINVNF
jgi:hypothetical protein